MLLQHVECPPRVVALPCPCSAGAATNAALTDQDPLGRARPVPFWDFSACELLSQPAITVGTKFRPCQSLVTDGRLVVERLGARLTRESNLLPSMYLL